LYTNIPLASELESNYTTKEVAAARRARTLSSMLFHPSDISLARTISKGDLVDNRVTGLDILRVNTLYPSEPKLKGMSSDMHSTVYTQHLVPSMAQKQQTVYADIFHWRGQNFMLFVIKPLMLVMVVRRSRSRRWHSPSLSCLLRL
jgi:hypothetical protein